MFSLPPPADRSTPQGSTDETPIVLQDDPEEFRALCWVVYALPSEIISQNDVKRVDIPRLVSLARISRKYQFESIERWTLEVLTAHLNPHSTCKFLDECPIDFVIKILEVSLLSSLKLEEHIIGKWLGRIQNGQFDIAYALNVAERLKLRKFQGSLYYAQLNAISEQLLKSPSNSLNVYDLVSKLPLTADQKNRLYAGAWSLSLLGIKTIDYIAHGRPEASFSPRCSSGFYGSRCIERWGTACRNALPFPSITGNSVDHLAGVKQMIQALEGRTECRNETSYMCSTCRNAGISMAKRELERLQTETNLADYFLGVEKDE
ncbi:hypothetical protein AX16_004598 [Volvariella volvacea WC 439]|nr:hypothetical protein AX16_004598 [Volvariella volvacea WC 439]